MEGFNPDSEAGVDGIAKSTDAQGFAPRLGLAVAPVEKVTEAHLYKLFDNGQRRMLLSHAAKQLRELAGVGKTTAYAALKFMGGKFSHLLISDSGLITIRPRVATAGSDENDVEL